MAQERTTIGKDAAVDLESGGGARPLYPTMPDSPELRWAFIHKVYFILIFQILLTIAVASTFVAVRPVSNFFVSTIPGFVLFVVLLISPHIIMCPLYYYRRLHPVNLILLALFTVTSSFGVGLSCEFTSGKVILESSVIAAVVVVSLPLYTFWAARRGHDFGFLCPFLFSALLALIVFAVIQVFFPLGKITTMIYGSVATVIFSGYIVYDTDNLIKRHSYDDYIWASVDLYLDILNLFLSLLQFLRAVND